MLTTAAGPAPLRMGVGGWALQTMATHGTITAPISHVDFSHRGITWRWSEESQDLDLKSQDQHRKPKGFLY